MILFNSILLLSVSLFESFITSSSRSISESLIVLLSVNSRWLLLLVLLLFEICSEFVIELSFSLFTGIEIYFISFSRNNSFSFSFSLSLSFWIFSFSSSNFFFSSKISFCFSSNNCFSSKIFFLSISNSSFILLSSSCLFFSR